ncbi:acyl-CoA thioester hydrolase/BAAT C-terminal domain-containing protein [Sphingomonas cynarae]
MPNRRELLIGSTVAFVTTAASARSPLPSTATRIEVRQDGLVGRLHLMSGMRSQTAVIMLNGSDGGVPSARDADDLAANGYPTLALAYFQDWRGQPDGVPASLNDIPLEYFFRAIDWLKRRSEVDPARIVVMGQSRGGELALLLGSLRPDLAGIIAFSPSSRVWSGIPAYGAPPAAMRPAWTLAGQAAPFQDTAFDPALPMRQWFERAKPIEAARIQVERIHGPVLLASSKADTIWPADTYADEIAARLRTRPGKARVINLTFDDASHLLMGIGPGITKMEVPGAGFTFDFGGTAAGTARARAAAWAASKRLCADL